MATIVGVRCRDGVVVAGDRVLVRDGRIASRSRQHVFDLDDGLRQYLAWELAQQGMDADVETDEEDTREPPAEAV